MVSETLTYQEARELIGPGTPRNRDFLEYLTQLVNDKGVMWVKSRAEYLLAQWEYVRTLL